MLNQSILLLVSLLICKACNAFSPQGTAAAPLDKKKVAVIGGGGYIGALTFGFLQRAGSLYGTGIDKNCRVIGATSMTASTLNTILGKHFVLAQADETFIKLTNMEVVESIQKSLEGYDAVIMGSSMFVEQGRPVTAGTFETSPNSKTMEIYWDSFRGNEPTAEDEQLAQKIIDNTLEACKKAGIQHIVAVQTKSFSDTSDFGSRVFASGVPCTWITCPDELRNAKDYTYIKGVQENLEVSKIDKGGGVMLSSPGTIYREDLAALAVQCLLSLDWSESRTLTVQSKGSPIMVDRSFTKRPDQQWCVNEHVLAGKLLSCQ